MTDLELERYVTRQSITIKNLKSIRFLDCFLREIEKHPAKIISQFWGLKAAGQLDRNAGVFRPCCLKKRRIYLET